MRLDKYLANAGYGTRKEVKQKIRKKQVYVNDELCQKEDYKIDETNDQVRIDGLLVEFQSQVYLMLNKPSGVITATKDSHHATIFDCIDEHLPLGCFPVGRLDIDSEGLLLITNDGKLAHDLLSPKKHVDKTYYVECQKTLDDCAVKRLREGILIDGEACLPAKVQCLTPTSLTLTIQEGKFHQVKRMLLAVDNQVVYLKRIQMGPLRLDKSLPKGGYRYLCEEEINKLKERN